MFHVATKMTNGMEEDDHTRRLLDRIFPNGMHLREARQQLDDIHHFVAEQESRDEKTRRAVEEFRSEIIITDAELPRVPVRLIYVLLARHQFRLLRSTVERADGVVRERMIEVDHLVGKDRLVVYLAKAFLPEISLKRAGMDYSCLEVAMRQKKRVKLVLKKGSYLLHVLRNSFHRSDALSEQCFRTIRNKPCYNFFSDEFHPREYVVTRCFMWTLAMGVALHYQCEYAVHFLMSMIQRYDYIRQQLFIDLMLYERQPLYVLSILRTCTFIQDGLDTPDVRKIVAVHDPASMSGKFIVSLCLREWKMHPYDFLLRVSTCTTVTHQEYEKWRGIVLSNAELSKKEVYDAEDVATGQIHAIMIGRPCNVRIILQFLYDIEYLKRNVDNLHFLEILVREMLDIHYVSSSTERTSSMIYEICLAWRNGFGATLRDFHPDELVILDVVERILLNSMYFKEAGAEVTRALVDVFRANRELWMRVFTRASTPPQGYKRIPFRRLYLWQP
eukprot:6214617-Pleurochrysis_carterae.AAC.1